MMGEMEDEVHAKRLVRKSPKITDLPLQQMRRAQLRLQNAKSAGIADRGYQLRSREIGAHRCDHDRSIEPKQLAKAGSDHFAIPYLSG
jgi:hypothetical protein